jgi:hypothetical protein
MSKRSSLISNLGQTATETHKMLKTVNENNKYESAAIKCMKSRQLQMFVNWWSETVK